MWQLQAAWGGSISSLVSGMKPTANGAKRVQQLGNYGQAKIKQKNALSNRMTTTTTTKRRNLWELPCWTCTRPFPPTTMPPTAKNEYHKVIEVYHSHHILGNCLFRMLIKSKSLWAKSVYDGRGNENTPSDSRLP